MQIGFDIAFSEELGSEMALFGPANQLDQATRKQTECLIAELVVQTAENAVMLMAECWESTGNLCLAYNRNTKTEKR